MHRCGTDTPEESVALARRIAREPASCYRGVMGYEGHAVLVPDAAKRKELAEAALAQLLAHVRALRARGSRPRSSRRAAPGTFELTGSRTA